MRLMLALCLLLPMTARAEVSEIRITKQPGIIYLAPIVMQQKKLVEARAEALGLHGFEAKYVTFGGGGAATDALLSGNVDVVTTGPSNMLLLWDRTKGQVKGLASSSATPMWLVSRNPAVKSLRDLGPEDRIAVPTVKISTQAILLQIAARKLYGDADFAHFDAMTVTLAHPDAATAVTTGSGGVSGHFSGPPFQAAEAKAPGVHVVTTSTDILGGPVSNAIYFAAQKWHDANPTVVKAFLQAAEDAEAFIAAHPREACELYIAATGEKASVDELVRQIGEPGMIYSTTPYGMMTVALHMADTKVLKVRPANWHDFFFPEAFNLPGN